MELSDYLPFWGKLTEEQRRQLTQAAQPRTLPKGSVIQRGGEECLGLLLMGSGQLRACLLSEEGREITLYRLFDRDICLFSASCMLQSIQFDITLEVEKESAVWVIPAPVARQVMEVSAPMANYINELMAARFSEVMWLVEQILWKSFDKRLAAFLLEESILEGDSVLSITHEAIGRHLGTAREVVTRMLRYFQSEGLVELTRGRVRLLNQQGLQAMQR